MPEGGWGAGFARGSVPGLLDVVANDLYLLQHRIVGFVDVADLGRFDAPATVQRHLPQNKIEPSVDVALPIERTERGAHRFAVARRFGASQLRLPRLQSGGLFLGDLVLQRFPGQR